MTHEELVETVSTLKSLAMSTPEGRAAFVQIAVPESQELTKCREAWRAQRRVLNDCRSWLLGRLAGTTSAQLLDAINAVLGNDEPACGATVGVGLNDRT